MNVKLRQKNQNDSELQLASDLIDGNVLTMQELRDELQHILSSKSIADKILEKIQKEVLRFGGECTLRKNGNINEYNYRRILMDAPTGRPVVFLLKWDSKPTNFSEIESYLDDLAIALELDREAVLDLI